MNIRRDTSGYSPLALGCFAALLLSIAAYLYFLNLSVVEVVIRTEHETRMKELYSELADLESAYIGAEHAIAIKVADIADYETDADKIFLAREPDGVVLGVNQ